MARNSPFGDSVPSVLQVGSVGPAVRELQAKLAVLGLPVAVDGSFGQATENALRQFQSAENLSVTGTFTPETEGRLNQRILSAQATMQNGQSADAGVLTPVKDFLDPSKRPLWQTGLMVLGGIAIVGGIFYMLGEWDDRDMEKMEKLPSRTVEHDDNAPTRYKRSVKAHGSSLRGAAEKCARTPGEDAFEEGAAV